MSLSLNEVEATAKRAARGAGYPWGLAEEAGKATRWLCTQSLDGCAALAAVLEAGFAGALDAHMPDIAEPAWRGAGVLCPLGAGAALSDMAARLTDGSLVLHDVARPEMLLPFAAGAAERIGAPVTLASDGVVALTDGRGLCLDVELPDRAARVTVAMGGDMTAHRTVAARATPDRDAWAQLEALAGRTYAPATEESRRLGAGAGLGDND